jgi:hypothetical protein
MEMLHQKPGDRGGAGFIVIFANAQGVFGDLFIALHRGGELLPVSEVAALEE